MSFSGRVKEELASRVPQARHCCLAEITGMLLYSGKMQQTGENDWKLSIQTENESVARKFFTLLIKTFNIDKGIIREGLESLKHGNMYAARIHSDEDIRKILEGTKLEQTDLTDRPGEGYVNNLIIQSDCCKRAFLRGVYLACGSISDPEKGYHFEIVCAGEQRANDVKNLIRGYHIDAKVIQRKKSYIVYVKEGSQIVDLLALMGASKALLDLENIRVVKEVRNSINRRVNCETANLNKTVSASVKQVDDIRMIAERIGLENLSEGLREVAELRIQFSDASLKELGEMMEPPVGKSGVNHRLRKLAMIAEKLRSSNEEDCYD